MMLVDVFDPWFRDNMSTNDETMMTCMMFCNNIPDESCTQRNIVKLSESTSYIPDVHTCGC